MNCTDNVCVVSRGDKGYDGISEPFRLDESSCTPDPVAETTDSKWGTHPEYLLAGASYMGEPGVTEMSDP